MKVFKQRWSTIQPISTKQTITFNLRLMTCASFKHSKSFHDLLAYLHQRFFYEVLFPSLVYATQHFYDFCFIWNSQKEYE